MNISDLISGGIGSQAISAIANKLGIDESKAKWIVAAAVPLMIAALNYNAKNKGQSEAIDKAIDQHSGGGILDKIGDLFSGNSSEEGNKIVSHIFGNNTETVTQNLADKAGLNSQQVGGVLATLAPIVMGYLGQQKQGASNGGGLGDLIGSVLGGGGASTGGGIGDLLGNVRGGNAATPEASSGQNVTDMLGNLAGEFFNKGNDSQGKGNILDNIAGMFGK